MRHPQERFSLLSTLTLWIPERSLGCRVLWSLSAQHECRTFLCYVLCAGVAHVMINRAEWETADPSPGCSCACRAAGLLQAQAQLVSLLSPHHGRSHSPALAYPLEACRADLMQGGASPQGTWLTFAPLWPLESEGWTGTSGRFG